LPSTELRKKFHNGEEKFEEFVKNYKKELLENNMEELQRIKDLAKKKKITFYMVRKMKNTIMRKCFLI